MTSRLKRKLDDLDGGNLGESFVKFGTPLPSLADTKKDAGEFVPVWKQEVRDEQGRRRLHGAWTGGFSAGYFNTVGSKEGWTPSTFKSSRSSKSSASTQQRAEDFMDDEDRAELRGSQHLQTNAEFDLLGGTAADISRQKAQPDALRDLVEPSKDRIGERLLRKMGWRDGQGVGPRVSAKTRRRQAAELGVSLDAQDEHDEADKHTFPPLDRPLVLYDAKDDARGLGFSAGQTLYQATAGPSRPKERDAGEGAARNIGGAFGIGAMEEADDDDFSVYDAAAMPGGARNMVLMDEDDEMRPPTRPAARPAAPRKIDRQAGKVFNDGTPVIEHFVVASRSQPPDRWFEPPTVPKDWQPDPKRVFATNLQAPPQPSGKAGLNADERGSILGEEAIKAPAPSVFDYISAKNKERLTAFVHGGGQPSTSTNATPLPDDAAPLQVPPLDPTVAAAALKGFLPFGDDLAKQARYKRYLEHHAGLRPDEAFTPWARGGAVDQLNNELNEFAASARIFKPMSNSMASRFTSSSTNNIILDAAAIQPGLRKPAPAPVEAEVKAEPTKEDERKPTTAAGMAVRNNDFGRLTRTTTRFYPARLLCKRFNVPDPHPDGPSVDEVVEEPLGQRKMGNVLFEAPPPAVEVSAKTDEDMGYVEPLAKREGPPKSLAAVGLGEDETQGRDTLTYERPPDALFKAIFADSDDDEEEEDEAPAPVAAVAEPAPSWMGKKASEPPAVEVKVDDEPIIVDDGQPFRPTFTRKIDRQTTTTTNGDSGEKKAKKKKKEKATALSFTLEEDGAPLAVQPTTKRRSDDEPKKVKKRRKEEEVLWVEKEQPVATTAKPASQRMKASDLY